MKRNSKIVGLESLRRAVRRLKAKGRTIAFTNGCFDILHYGHVTYLQAAKTSNRVLIVGLNSDTSIKRIKGRGRPINNQRVRANVLAALACVDFVTVFSEDTPIKVIKALKPDILIKGADWKGKRVVGRDIVEEGGGRVELIRYIRGYSTTQLIKAIKKNG